MLRIARVAYSYNSLLEGSQPYSLDAIVVRNGETRIDVCEHFDDYEAFSRKVEEIIPVLEDIRNEDRQEQAEDE